MRSSKDFYMTIVGSALEDNKVIKCKSRDTEDAIYHQQIEILSSPGILCTIHFSAELFSTAQAQPSSSPQQFWARKHAYIGMPEEETGTGAGGQGKNELDGEGGGGGVPQLGGGNRRRLLRCSWRCRCFIWKAIFFAVYLFL